jgi:hypothetical protein
MLLTAALAQVPVTSQFDEGVVVGRVCEDLDGDARCSADEPGVEGARVLLETGLEALADRDGRFHFAGVSARSAEAVSGGRLAPGRHRAKIEAGSLLGGWRGHERGRTFELPMGAAVFIEFPLQRGAVASPALSTDATAVRRVEKALEYELALSVPEGERASIDGVDAPEGRRWVPLTPGLNVVPVALQQAGQLRLWSFRIDVVEREGSTLLVPRGLTSLGLLSWSTSGVLTAELQPGVKLAVDGQPLPLDPSGRAAKPMTGDEVSLRLELEGRSWSQSLRRLGANGLTLVGLLDAQAQFDVRTGGLTFAGRGAASARATFGGFKLGVELDLRDTDLLTPNGFQARTLLDVRRVDVFQRQLDPMRSLTAFADDSATVASNPSEGRFRVELSREGWGRLGYGSARWFQAAADAGRMHRAVQGAFLELRTPTAQSPFGLELNGVAAPAQADFQSGLARRPMHERFESTGGSLFFLAKQTLVAGSEAVRVEWRDAVTQLPVRDVHLQRGRDYTIDLFSGRILLARPLSFFVGESLLQSDPLTAGLVGVLVVDYEYLETGLSTDGVLGGELRARLGPVKLTGSAFRDGAYGLYRAGAEAKLGPVWLSAETAHSQGSVQGLAFSRDGGLSHVLSTPSALDTSGWAVTLRARSKGLFNKGHWDLAWRWRQAGFEDVAQVGALNQVSLRGEQPLGPVVVAALVDFRDMADPRDPFSGARIRGRTLGGAVGYERDDWGIRLEVREFEQTLSDVARGGLTLGLAGRYRIAPWLQLRAGYRQQVLALGGMDLSFGSLGVDVKPTEKLELGVRGGWGPALGPQVWGTASYSKGDETWYGVHAIDPDAPGTGERRLVTGVRQQIDPGTAVFVEDVSATDVSGLRLARAVGLSQRLDEAFTVSARYEHGARALEGLGPEVARNAGGLTLAYEQPTLRFFARGEVRDEQGASPLRQFVATGGGEWRVHRDVSVTARALWTHSTKNDVMVGRSLDATASFAWRFGRGAVLARYAYQQNWTAAFEQRLHVVSVLPTMQFGDRFALGAGAHLGLTSAGPILSGSLRPSVRIWEGLEVAAEAAARSLAPDGGSWASVRGEVGYRFDHRFFVGAGYNAFGFSGTGLDTGATGSRDRVYLRTEVTY